MVKDLSDVYRSPVTEEGLPLRCQHHDDCERDGISLMLIWAAGILIVVASPEQLGCYGVGIGVCGRIWDNQDIR
jgi:hypothetical protein